MAVVVPVAETGSSVKSDNNILRVDLPSPAAAAASWLSCAQGRNLLAASHELPHRARLAAPVCTSALAAAQHFDLVYVLRLYLAGTALPFLAQENTTRLILDIDEDDAAVTRQLACLFEQHGEHQAAHNSRAQAAVQERFATAALTLFDQVACASEVEAAALNMRGIPALALPNAVTVRQQAHAAAGAPRVLFLGNLNYQPNRDAALRLVNKILPAVRRKIPDARLLLAGSGGESLREACCSDHNSNNGVDWLGYVENVDTLYDRATVIVAPLRAGGGSRLKILEAFERGRPVVATHKAVEGLAVTDGRHALLAESDGDLADAVIRLAGDAALASSMTSAARQLVIDLYSIEALSRRVNSIVKSLPGAT